MLIRHISFITQFQILFKRLAASLMCSPFSRRRVLVSMLTFSCQTNTCAVNIIYSIHFLAICYVKRNSVLVSTFFYICCHTLFVF